MDSKGEIERILSIISDVRVAIDPSIVIAHRVTSSAFEKTDKYLDGVVKVVEEARKVINGEGDSLEASYLDGAIGFPSPAEDIKKFHAIIDKTVLLYSETSANRLREAETVLKPYEGLPVHFDILSLMGVDRSETVFCQLLLWLLTPESSHGVGDAFLRLFLARLGVDCQGRLFDYSQSLNAEIVSEVSWDIPNGELFQPLYEQTSQQKSEKSRRLRVDILIMVQGYIIPVEVKVYASESLYKFNDQTWAQAALYGEMWRLMLEAYRSSLRFDKNTSSSHFSSFQGWRGAWEKCTRANKGLERSKHFFDAGRAAVVPVLIHPRHQCISKHEYMGERKYEHGLPVRHIDWLDIDKMLYRLCIDRDLQLGRLDLIRSFRTTILRLATGIDLVSNIEDLRLRIAEPALTRRFPVASSASLDVALAELNHVDSCCDEAVYEKLGGRIHDI
ncbi:MAG: PD-(D/E)XK nuclease family protein [Marivita sp.]|uniref:PD-(D/E)XK nuclease family protein n=1 Tax=Marivita sp. TaxID=2003365 RepID=UPI001B052007|nr:PD-(D/E)XK nuclease family protein [Marivita sp.]MBO6883050.1 PD-(D/E)XK nuclease family protein [Marivita sp.]